VTGDEAWAARDAPDSEAGSPAARVARLRESFADGLTRPLAWRLSQLDALTELLGDAATKIEQALAADLGKPPMEAFLSDVASVRREVAALRRGLPRWSRDERVRLPWVLRPGRAWIRREPVGVVLVVAPWNYPINLVLVPLAAALAAGNCVIAKPSELAPATSSLLARLVGRYLDPRAVAVVEGGAEAAIDLIGTGVDHVFFTGSARVGRLVAEAAGRHLTPVTLELGGKSPAIVLRDADLDVAARRIAWGRFMNAGQTCVAPDYVLVQRDVEREFLDAAARAVRDFYGRDPALSDDYGRIVNDAHLTRLQALLASEPGEIVTGGVVERPGRYLAPTVVRTGSSSPLMEEEIFGPVLPVIAVDDAEAAAAFVASRPAPLTLSVFTRDMATADRVIAATRSGSVSVNTTVEQFAASTLPFGGIGPSGTGRYHGRFGYEELSQLRPVLVRPTRPDLGFAYPPYRRWASKLLRRVL